MGAKCKCGPFLLCQLCCKDNCKIQLHCVLYQNCICSLDYTGLHKEQFRRSREQSCSDFLVFSCSLAKEKTSAIFIACYNCWRCSPQVDAQPKGRKPAECAQKDLFFLRFRRLHWYTLYHRDANRKVNDFDVACCFMLLNLGNSIIFKTVFFIKKKLWSNHILILGLETGSL